MLKSIAVVTILVNQLAPVESAWLGELGYEAVHRGQIGDAPAAVWQAPSMAGAEFLIMGPASGEPVYVRVVEREGGTGPAPGLTYGWNATELLARDPDALQARFEDSPFEVVGPARPLWNAPNAPRAMQAVGPANELLYFTRIIPDGFPTPMRPATTDVDRVFIMVVGGPSIAELQAFYRRLGLDVGEAQDFRITTLSRAHGLPADTTYPLAMAAMPRDFLIELDGYPESATARESAGDELPPGVAMVSFIVDDLDALDVPFRAEPRAIGEFPYSGRRVAATVGPAGEWVEFIEAGLR